MRDALEELVASLLYEGYALYPYTAGATKNATPTPFGIVYPPAYAERSPTTFSMSRVDCLLEGEGEGEAAEIRFLQASGDRHKGVERRVALSESGGPVEFEFSDLRGRARLRVDDAAEGLRRVHCCVHNTTELEDADIGRAEALTRSLLSTHLLVRTKRGRFLSPLDHPGESVNSYPVLASPQDDAVLGATIVLPDHPELAPESLGNLFDNTEIEEALLLHVHALSEGEREDIAAQDPVVREMIERAERTTPEELMDLHGRMELSDPGAMPEQVRRLDAARAGEPEAEVGGVIFRRGGKVKLRPGTDGDVYDRMLHGRTATVRRIYVDYDGKVHIGVSVDGDLAHELLGDSGRYLFFSGAELEAFAE